MPHSYIECIDFYYYYYSSSSHFLLFFSLSLLLLLAHRLAIFLYLINLALFTFLILHTYLMLPAADLEQ